MCHYIDPVVVDVPMSSREREQYNCKFQRKVVKHCDVLPTESCTDLSEAFFSVGKSFGNNELKKAIPFWAAGEKSTAVL